MRLPDGAFHYKPNQPVVGWYHMVLVFHGPNEGQGISVYHDGVLVKNDPTKNVWSSYTENSGNVVIGKLKTDTDEGYGSVMVDELMFWDRQLLAEEITAIAAMG